MVKHFKNGFILLLTIVLVSSILYLALNNASKRSLAAGIERSLQLNAEADGYLAAGKYNEALALLLESLSLNRLNPTTHAYLGLVYNRLGQYQEAYEYFVQSFNMGGLSPEVAYELSELFFRSGHYQEAIVYLRDTMAEFPDRRDLSLQLGKAYCLSGDYKRSIKTLEDLLTDEEYEVPAEIYKYLGLAHHARGKEKEAKGYYRLYLQETGGVAEGSAAELHSLIWGDDGDA